MEPLVSELVREAKEVNVREAASDLRLLVLYGSEARGEATPESDVDFLIVLETVDQAIVRRIRDAIYDLMWRHDFACLFSLHIMQLTDYEHQKHYGYSFVRSVDDEGLVLWRAA